MTDKEAAECALLEKDLAKARERVEYWRRYCLVLERRLDDLQNPHVAP